jgi:hypothetical protein
MQNAKDAEVEYNAPFSVEHTGNKLTITNEGCTLNHRALLLGETTKADRDDLIGQWGDGLKIGVLGLLRSGHPVTIKSGDEIWHTSIDPAPEYDGAEVLTFNIRKSRMYRNSVEVEIDNVDKVDWLSMANRFRFLPGEKYRNVVYTGLGDLLIDEPGMLYAKGIFVEKIADMEYGYDFKDVELDIDRRAVNSWSREYACKRLLEQAMIEKPDLAKDVFRILCDGKKDAAYFQHSGFKNEANIKAMKDLWVERHGVNTIPIANEEDAIKLEHLGVRGVVVNPAAVAALGAVIGTVESTMAELAFATKEAFDPDSIPEGEMLLEAMCVLESANHPIDLKHFEVVDFKDPNIFGQYDCGTIKIARKQLANGLSATIGTLAHELAHGMESKGFTHGQAMQKILEDVITSLLGRKAA